DGPAFVRPTLHCAPDHGLVAEMEAVEIAERDHRAAKRLRDRLVEGQALHQSVIARSKATKQSILTASILDCFAALAMTPRAHGLDSPDRESYMASIPLHRFTGGAFVRASVLSLAAG